jgi:translation initiation factor 6 (eIF-6)
MSRFETLVREITNTTIADVRKVGEEKYLNSEGVYTVFVALEVRKAAMYRHLKKQARLDTELSEAARKELERMLDAEIEKAEAAERDGTD